jgi:hypothetical protein
MHTNTILSIWNAGSKGKSTTILNLANILLTNFPNHVIFCSQNVLSLAIDFRLIIQINNKTIALESQGDPKTNLEKRLDDIVIKYQPDLIVCSTRTRGETVHAVENIANKYNFDIIWTSTYQITHSQNIANIAKADHLLDLIQRLGLI